MPTINRVSRIEMILVDDYCIASAIACVLPTSCIANAIHNTTGVPVTCDSSVRRTKHSCN
jgi:hypothetical protein